MPKIGPKISGVKLSCKLSFVHGIRMDEKLWRSFLGGCGSALRKSMSRVEDLKARRTEPPNLKG
jgi:hypothetical protein